MNDDRDEPVTSEVAERARQLQQNLKLPPETARITAEDEAATGPGKPASRDVDEARAAEARASDPDARI